MSEEGRDGVGYGCLELKMLDCNPVATAVDKIECTAGGAAKVVARVASLTVCREGGQ